MFKLLFWNLGRQGLSSWLLTSIVAEHNPTVVVLAECGFSITEAREALNQAGGVQFQFAYGNCPKLRFFTRFQSSWLTAASEGERYSIRRLVLPGADEVIIAGAHLPSQLYFGHDDLVHECRSLSEALTDVEKEAGHSRSIFVGDFNLNPFDVGITSAAGLNATMSRRVAERRQRTVQARSFKYFFNPMWAFMNDKSGSNAGTFYYEPSAHVGPYWNTFDQILIRPDLIHLFSYDNLRVVSHAGPQSLIDLAGKPNKLHSSDHLPIILEL